MTVLVATVSAAYDQTVATDAVTSASLLARAEAERAAGHGAEASVLYRQAADLAARNGDLDTQAEAVLGLARCQEYKLTPGSLPVQLHATYSRSTDPVFRARLAAALARAGRTRANRTAPTLRRRSSGNGREPRRHGATCGHARPP